MEMDVDGCALTFGEGACPAYLGVGLNGAVRKCYNLYDTCAAKQAFQHKKNWRVMRYCQPRSGLPKGQTWYPVMQGQPSEDSATVNIAGSDSSLSAFGRRATVSVSLTDFPDHERYWDQYQPERISGAAQRDGIGYDPYFRGTHFGKLKSRWPYYANRPMRICSGYIENGVISDVSVRHYVVTNISGPDNNGKVSVEGSDVLTLADNDKTRWPAASNGKLDRDIGMAGDSFNLTPSGVGNAEYPSSGWAKIGSELVTFSRSGDAVTLSGRGLQRTVAANHKIGDTMQVAKVYDNTRVDNAIYEMLVAVGVPASFLPLGEWAAEVNRWLPSCLLTRVLAEPTGIKALISSMVPLGFSIWWDAKAQRVRLKANRPIDSDVLWRISDDTHIQSVGIAENDAQRAASVLFWTVQKDPTKSTETADNYDRTWVSGDPSALESWRYGSGAVKNFYCPWMNNGADAIVRVAADRLLDRFATTPKKATILLDAIAFRDISLTDVVLLTTRGLQDETGQPITERYQVIERSEPKAGERIQVVVQRYQFDGRFPYATPNDTPTYMLATPAQRDPGMFACDNTTLLMPNGDPPYEAI